ncbi:aminoglycoside phosphotransferase family protein [Sporosarcina sp. Te-1]|uniref:aminoglycoside phosphotransferase family protein n=1 Tax=Sporosarcina sp. Te-1 TaxID=2818390 RepID=UPI001A9EFF23|nr:aminoglycoside phosphotransferase family protein [Sporosarcina sp. Te-1]QTD41597.1 aminoglycoside phosphotransferase family protein [Sporosarcina sp. Te-1]
MKQIKENVWKVEDNGSKYSLKRYHSMSTAVKVKHVHEELEKMDFPHIVPVLPTEDRLLLQQPWMENARPVSYKRRADRTDSLAALQALHQTDVHFDWKASPYLHTYPLLTKWVDRLSRFLDHRIFLQQMLGVRRVQEIIFYAKEALPIVRQYNREPGQQTLLHGDVVHHNILRDQNGVIRLIDFDLACISSPDTELALWSHRVLPHVSYNVNFLFGEQRAIGNMNPGAKAMLLYPNELLREWLHLLTLPDQNQQKLARQLIPFTEAALSAWPKLWYDVEHSMK